MPGSTGATHANRKIDSSPLSQLVCAIHSDLGLSTDSLDEIEMVSENPHLLQELCPSAGRCESTLRASTVIGGLLVFQFGLMFMVVVRNAF